MVKTFKNLLQNRKSYDLETWYAALGTQALQSCINGDPGLTLTYFTARSNLEIKAFLKEKSENSGFFRNYCSLSPESWYIQTTN